MAIGESLDSRCRAFADFPRWRFIIDFVSIEDPNAESRTTTPMATQQSPDDRLRRLNQGCCPIHGIWMPQVDRWQERIGGALDGAQVTIVECPRKDCSVQAFAASVDGPWELLPDFQHLLGGES